MWHRCWQEYASRVQGAKEKCQKMRRSMTEKDLFFGHMFCDAQIACQEINSWKLVNGPYRFAHGMARFVGRTKRI